MSTSDSQAEVKNRILITGGAGFIGFHLASRLAADPENHLTLLDNLSRGRHDAELTTLLERDDVELIDADLTSPGAFSALDTCDEVYHLAAMLGVENVQREPDRVVRVNALATLNLLDWFAGGGGRKLLFASTSEVYAWTQQFHPLPVPTPEDVPLALTDLDNPRSSYAGSKIFGELAVRQYCRQRGQPFVIVRFHNVYGPRMGMDHVIPQIHARVLGGENPLTVYSADHLRAFCFIDDAVRLVIELMRNPRADGTTFNVGNDQEEVRIDDLAARILAQTGRDYTMRPEIAVNDPIQRRCPDVSLARQRIGYAPQVPLDEGLRQTLAWYEQWHAAQGRA